MSRARYRDVPYEITIRDCIESLFYVLMFTSAYNHLPWSHAIDHRNVYSQKQQAIESEFRRFLIRAHKDFRRLLVEFRDLLFGSGLVFKEVTVDSVKELLSRYTISNHVSMTDEDVCSVAELEIASIKRLCAFNHEFIALRNGNENADQTEKGTL